MYPRNVGPRAQEVPLPPSDLGAVPGDEAEQGPSLLELCQLLKWREILAGTW